MIDDKNFIHPWSRAPKFGPVISCMVMLDKFLNIINYDLCIRFPTIGPYRMQFQTKCNQPSILWLKCVHCSFCRMSVQNWREIIWFTRIFARSGLWIGVGQQKSTKRNMKHDEKAINYPTIVRAPEKSSTADINCILMHFFALKKIWSQMCKSLERRY